MTDYSYWLRRVFCFSTANDASLDFFETLRRRYPEAYPLLYTDLIIDFLFMIDILMNFRTTYVKEGEVLITNPWKIAVHYFKTYFVVDFVAAIPWDLLASFNSGTEEVSAWRAKLYVWTEENNILSQDQTKTWVKKNKRELKVIEFNSLTLT